MATFTAPVVSIRDIEPIPSADAIELAVIGEYRSVVRKGQFRRGDKAIYLPEAAVLPMALLEQLNLVGKLAGPEKNRVKAIRLRGCLSQGILYPEVPAGAEIGEDMAQALGVVKYEPPIPENMAGEVSSLFGYPLKYDIENYKAFPEVVQIGEPVEMTEKAHGTLCGIAVIPGLGVCEMFDNDGIVYSKGLGAKGLVFKNVEANAENLYVRTARALAIHDRIRRVYPGRTVHVLGETYGAEVQDLTYGRQDQGFAVFDVSVDGAYLSRDALAEATACLGLDHVPVLYRGPFDLAALAQHKDGKSVLGGGSHLREDVVITPLTEREDEAIGRVVLKSVSGDYLLRKGNATEFA